MRWIDLLLLAPVTLIGCGEAPTPSAAPANVAAAIASPAIPATEAERAYAAVNDKMHAEMGRIDADPDVAFMQGMIPHHRGAVEMAEVVLKYGKDPATHDLAKRIIAAQQGEIAEMEAWLAKRGKAAAPAGDMEHHGHH